MLPSPEALWSSHDGTHLLYATFNDTDVGTLTFPWFSTSGSVLMSGVSTQKASNFPSSRSVKYPTVKISCRCKEDVVKLSIILARYAQSEGAAMGVGHVQFNEVRKMGSCSAYGIIGKVS